MKKVLLYTSLSLVGGIKWIKYCLNQCHSKVHLTVKEFISGDILSNLCSYTCNYTNDISSDKISFAREYTDIFINTKDVTKLKMSYIQYYKEEDALHLEKKAYDEVNYIIENNISVVLIRYFTEMCYFIWLLSYLIKKRNKEIKIICGTFHIERIDFVKEYFIEKNIVDYFIYGNPNPYLQKIIDNEQIDEKIITNYKYTKDELINTSKTVLHLEMNNRIATLIPSVSCYRKCSFCTNAYTKCNYLQLEPEAVASIMAYYQRNFGIMNFLFSNSNLKMNQKYKKIYENYIVNDIFIEINEVESFSDIAHLIEFHQKKRKSKITIRAGIESLSENVLKKMNKSYDATIKMLKNIPFVDTDTIQYALTNIFNYFIEDKKEFEESYQNYIKLIPDRKNISLSFFKYRCHDITVYDEESNKIKKNYNPDYNEFYQCKTPFITYEHTYENYMPLNDKVNKLMELRNIFRSTKIGIY